MSLRFLSRLRAALLATLVSAVLAVLIPATARAALLPPSRDPFYTYSGSLSNKSPGTVLASRSVTIELGGEAPAFSATQVLYRTTDQLGQPDATVATIIHPATPGPIKLVSYQTAYDGLADTCRPSYQYQGGTPTNSTLEDESVAISAYLAKGFTVVTSDYEGSTDDFGAGRQEGSGTLDAIRAAEQQLGQPLKSTPVGLVGYSGGAIASMWAAQLQPTYSPQMDLIGVAAGGIAADFAHNLNYIDGSSDWAGAIPAVGLGLLRAYKLSLTQYLSAQGQQIVGQTAQGCLDPTADPGLTFADLLKPQYQDYEQVPEFVTLLNDSIMGRASTPAEPLFLGVGDSDGTGDGVMIEADDQQLAYQYCQKGDNVQFDEYPGLDHTQAFPGFETQALAFLQQRYAGVTPVSGCATITPGDPLTPLPHP